METVVIVASCESYRTGDFIAAARAQRLAVVVATDADSPFDTHVDQVVEIDLDDVAGGAAAIATAVPDAVAVVAIDDQGVRVAGAANAALGLKSNPPSSIDATRDKLVMRGLLAAAGVSQPGFTSVQPGDLRRCLEEVGLPAVVKPTTLAASRGVIRIDDIARADEIERRVRNIAYQGGIPPTESLIVEQYIAGDEMVVEGMIVDGSLEVLALIDKPVPLVGPFFEETMFVSPSRQSDAVQEAVIQVVAEAVEAIGIVTGPIHAEIRIDETGTPFVIEVAARSIGGLCGRALTFGLLAEPLESVVIRSATGRTAIEQPTRPATGVLMLPIPGAGRLTDIEGVDAALAIEGIDAVDITIPIGRSVTPLPEGDRYLGFVFATGLTPDDVQHALARAAAVIEPVIDGEYVESDGQSEAGKLG
ncbi:MAG: ATP-grasp domain-containing protein [Acidimicrobiia bacterium]|nr:ATP-grasp domain-containing protein [Acidimicrobiia bacterium]